MGKQIVSATPGGSFISWESFKGKLFVIEPLGVEKDIKTVHGLSDAVRANIYVLLGKDKSEDFEDALIFPRVVQGQTRKAVGSIVVGRLDQDVENQKKGQDPAWILREATPGDLKKAGDFWSKKSIKSASGGDDDDEYDEDEDDEDSF